MIAAVLRSMGEQIRSAIAADADLASSSLDPLRSAARQSRFGSSIPLSPNCFPSAASTMIFYFMETNSCAEIFTSNFAKKLRGPADE